MKWALVRGCCLPLEVSQKFCRRQYLRSVEIEICGASMDSVRHRRKIHEMREFYIGLVIARAERILLLAGLALEF